MLLSFASILPSARSIAQDTANSKLHYGISLVRSREHARLRRPNPTGEPIQNPSWMNLAKAKAPGWGMNGPGVSAEWSQGGESEWNSAAASADETRRRYIRTSKYRAAAITEFGCAMPTGPTRSENFCHPNHQLSKATSRNPLRFFVTSLATQDVIDPHDEVSMYWGWAFAWDGVNVATRKRAGAHFHRD